MKTQKKIALIATALVIGLTTSLPASPRGKHPVDSAIHKHGKATSAAPGNTVYPTSLIQHSGPIGKGIVRSGTR